MVYALDMQKIDVFFLFPQRILCCINTKKALKKTGLILKLFSVKKLFFLCNSEDEHSEESRERTKMREFFFLKQFSLSTGSRSIAENVYNSLKPYALSSFWCTLYNKTFGRTGWRY